MREKCRKHRRLSHGDYEMKLLSFSEKEMLELIPAQAILDYDRAKDVLEKVCQKQASLTFLFGGLEGVDKVFFMW